MIRFVSRVPYQNSEDGILMVRLSPFAYLSQSIISVTIEAIDLKFGIVIGIDISIHDDPPHSVEIHANQMKHKHF